MTRILTGGSRPRMPPVLFSCPLPHLLFFFSLLFPFSLHSLSILSPSFYLLFTFFLKTFFLSPIPPLFRLLSLFLSVGPLFFAFSFLLLYFSVFRSTPPPMHCYQTRGATRG